ncbi:MAG: hypothetical protein E7426_00945 [Ruminococcaceae bacterium]|nr:hypothetical protein [Oscillospiraceae bacterium]
MSIVKGFIDKWKSDYDFKTVIGAFGALPATVFYALYNGFLGIHHASLWHGTMCIYYILLAALRALIVAAERRYAARGTGDGGGRGVYITASALLLLLNLSLIVPISMLVRQQTPVDLTLIPAIAMAAYTTYKITMAAVHLRRRRTSADALVKLLRTIGFIDALVSVLTLQNTLIMVNARGDAHTLLPLTALTGGAIWLAALLLSVSALVRGVRMGKRAP